MNMISGNFPRLFAVLAPFGRALLKPLKPRSPRSAVRVTDIADIPMHMQRDIGLMDGHATPSRARKTCRS
jgi:hypothetical protein